MTQPPRIRVGLVDDQALVREGLRRLLDFAPEIEVVVEAQGGRDALIQLAQVKVDVLLLDVRMSDLSGPDVLRALKDQHILPATLMLTTFDDHLAFLESMRLGARGFILKDISFIQLLNDIKSVAAGGQVVRISDSDTTSELIPRKHYQSSCDLSEREREILRGLVKGCSNKEIGGLLHIKEGTVKNYVSSILFKLDVRDRTQAVLIAIERQMI